MLPLHSSNEMATPLPLQGSVGTPAACARIVEPTCHQTKEQGTCLQNKTRPPQKTTTTNKATSPGAPCHLVPQAIGRSKTTTISTWSPLAFCSWHWPLTTMGTKAPSATIKKDLGPSYLSNTQSRWWIQNEDMLCELRPHALGRNYQPAHGTSTGACTLDRHSFLPRAGAACSQTQ